MKRLSLPGMVLVGVMTSCFLDDDDDDDVVAGSSSARMFRGGMKVLKAGAAAACGGKELLLAVDAHGKVNQHVGRRTARPR